MFHLYISFEIHKIKKILIFLMFQATVNFNSQTFAPLSLKRTQMTQIRSQTEHI